MLRRNAPAPWLRWRKRRERPRRVMGLALHSSRPFIDAALVSTEGYGLHMRAAVEQYDRAPLSPYTQQTLQRLKESELPEAQQPHQPLEAVTLTGLIGEITELLADIACQLIARAGADRDSILAAGVWDGVGRLGADTKNGLGYFPLCNAARLAETSDLNIIDAFPERDIAAGGRGGPLLCLPHWILLGEWGDLSQAAPFWLWEVGGLSRLTFLPPRLPLLAASSQIDFQLVQESASGPLDGLRLPDSSTNRLVLASSNALSDDPDPDSHVEEISLKFVNGCRAPPEALKPAATAVLAMLHIDQTPANLTHLTGAEAPRVLGRLTPGSPTRWRLLLLEMADHNPQMLVLRDAM